MAQNLLLDMHDFRHVLSGASAGGRPHTNGRVIASATSREQSRPLQMHSCGNADGQRLPAFVS